MERGSSDSPHQKPAAAMGHHQHQQQQHSGETSSGGGSPASSSASSAVGGCSGSARATTSSGKAGKALKSSKVCGVCGDRAKSYHFGGISCDSCKAFFRRSVQNDAHRAFQCPYERHCDITINSRKCCQFCRFQKCLDIGMEKSWVMTEEERLQLLKQRMERKGGKQQQQQQVTPSAVATVTFDAASSRSPSGSTRGASPAVGIPEVQATATLQVVAGDSGGHESPSCQSLLEESELAATRDLVTKYEASFRSVPYPAELRDTNDSRSLIEVITIFTTTIKRLTHFAGQLESFVSLPKGDQVALLRCGMIEMCLIRAAYAYDANRGCWPDTRLALYADSPCLRVEDLRQVVSPELHTMHMKFNHDVRRMELDEATYMLLMLVVMFSPERPGLVREDLVSAAQDHYSLLLRRYMAWKHSPQTAAKLYPRLLLKLPDLRQLNDAHVQSQLELTASDIREIQRQFGIILHGLDAEVEMPGTSGGSHRVQTGNPSLSTRSQSPHVVGRHFSRTGSHHFHTGSASDGESKLRSAGAPLASESSKLFPTVITTSGLGVTRVVDTAGDRHHRHRRPLPAATVGRQSPPSSSQQRRPHDPTIAGPSDTTREHSSGGAGSEQMHILGQQTGRPAWFDERTSSSGDGVGAEDGNGVVELRRPPLHPSTSTEWSDISPDVTRSEKPP